MLTAAMAFAACDKTTCPPDGNNGGGHDSLDYRGMGKSIEDPVGAPLVLPAGVTTSGYRFSDTCYNENFRNRRGAGGMVRLCLTFTNSGNVPVTFTLPPGTIVIAQDKELQHGVLLTEVEDLVAPNTSVTILLEMFCLNKTRRPSDWGSRYRQGPVTKNKEVKALYDLLKGKEHLLEMTGNENPEEALLKGERQAIVQEALWEITDGSGKLTEEHKQNIKNLR